MQLAAPGHEERIGVARLLDAQRDVGQHFLGEPVAQVARRHVLAFAAGERRRVDLEVHRQRGQVDRDRRQRLGRLHRRQRRADREVVDAGDEDDVAGLRGVDRHALHAREREYLADLRLRRNFALRERPVEDRDFLPRLQAPAADAADAEPSDVARIIERAHLELERLVRVAHGCGHVRKNGLKKSPHVAAFRGHLPLGNIDIGGRPAVQRRRVDDGEIQLIFGGAELVEQLEGLVDDPFGPRAGPVDLVDDDDRCEAERQRLQRDEARLRHRAFDRVDQQQHAVDHPKNALDLAAKVGVPRRVDDIDLRVVVADRAVLREDRDAALALDVVAVHHPLADVLVLRERPGLHQQLVDERRLAVVDVGDDRDVAQCLGGRGHDNSVEMGGLQPPTPGMPRKTVDYSGIGGVSATNISQNPKLRL